jgi:tripartite-type tricarboxylate transporter receptor subunit TctC
MISRHFSVPFETLRTPLWALALAAAAILGAGPAAAQPSASKTVRMVIPFPPGGSNDTVARILAPSLSRAIGQSVIVENRPGGSSIIATSLVHRAPADGNALLIIGFSWFANAGLRSDLPYDTLKDFSGVARFDSSPFVISVHPSLPAKNIKELIALARTRPGQLAYASNGNGTGQHLTGEWLKLMTGIDLLHVPYQGGGPSLIAAIGGHTPVLVSTIPALVPALAGNKMRPLAVTSKMRAEQLKDVPTLAESGFPEFDLASNLGAVVRSGTPKETINHLSAELLRSMQIPEVKDALLRGGLVPAPLGPEGFDAVMRADVLKIQKIVKDAKIKLEN